jgi:pyruvate,orthophosphate dikinase
MKIDQITLREGDFISLNGSKGYIYNGRINMIKAAEENSDFQKFMRLCDEVRTMKIRTNADTPEDAAKARAFGAEGIGLFRTEHMFYGKNAEKPLFILRKMIASKTLEERRKALNELFPFVKADIKQTMAAMDGYPVTVRTLDPPLHEFIPQQAEGRKQIADSLKISMQEFDKRAEALHETNPMMGHRGVRLGITYPEITEMQVRAVFEAAAELLKEKKKPFPEIMIPVTCVDTELIDQFAIVNSVHAEVCAKFKMKQIPHLKGTMIEIPRAALTADKIAKIAQFFSFGTNDLTQMSFGFSRDDIGSFLPDYLDKKILPVDPFNILDREGVGQLIKIAVEKGRSTRKDLKIGICGEHGGEPSSVEFCYLQGFSYVSCSPFRVPIARLAAAQARIRDLKSKPVTKAKKVAKAPAKPVKKVAGKK